MLKLAFRFHRASVKTQTLVLTDAFLLKTKGQTLGFARSRIFRHPVQFCFLEAMYQHQTIQMLYNCNTHEVIVTSPMSLSWFQALLEGWWHPPEYPSPRLESVSHHRKETRRPYQPLGWTNLGGEQLHPPGPRREVAGFDATSDWKKITCSITSI